MYCAAFYVSAAALTREDGQDGQDGQNRDSDGKQSHGDSVTA